MFRPVFTMESRDPFLSISPLDHRYWAANRRLFDALSETLSEKAAVRYQVRVEAALLKALSRFIDDPDLVESIDGLEDRIDPEDVAAEEAVTGHNIRALVNIVRRQVPGKLAPWVHLGATSSDVLDTAMAMRVRDTVQKTILPLSLDLLDALIGLTLNEAETPQVGRTHGQHAVPITFGFAVAEYVSRLGQSLTRIQDAAGSLRGKLSGAVGAYNATSLITENPEILEKDFLSILGLSRADYANQIVEPEHMLRLLLEINVAFGVIANLADDLRHLQRSEIGEVSESFGADQVGSSTMPQKRNPWNAEHVKSLWKAFAPRAMTFYMDQISEHQRDLSNSASGRFIADYLAGFAAATARMKAVVESLVVHRTRMAENLGALGSGILAEPTYILLALSGHADAHEAVRKATLTAEKTGKGLMEVLKDSGLWPAVSQHIRKTRGTDAVEFYTHACTYSGCAADRARELARQYAELSQAMRSGGES